MSKLVRRYLCDDPISRRRVSVAWNYNDQHLSRISVPVIDFTALTWGTAPDKPGGAGKWLYHMNKLLTFVIFATVKDRRFFSLSDGAWLDRLELEVQLANPDDEDSLARILGNHSQPQIGEERCYLFIWAHTQLFSQPISVFATE